MKKDDDVKKRKQKYASLKQALEPRMVYDASVAADVHSTEAAAPVDTTQAQPTAIPTPQTEAAKSLDTSSKNVSSTITQEQTSQQSDLAKVADFSSFNTPAKELVFIDSHVQNAPLLLQGISSHAEVHFIDSSQNGLGQIKAILESENAPVSSIYVIAHEENGSFSLGSSVLNDTNLTSAYKADVAAWQSKMTTDGSISLFADKTTAGGSSEITKVLFGDASDVSASDTLRHEVVFIDPSVANYLDLIGGVNANAQIVILDGTKDGISQISSYLQDKTDIDAIHIVSHGSQGSLVLGTSNVDIFSMAKDYAAQLADIGTHLSKDADILIYGCDFGEGAIGQAASTELAFLTSADVASSTNLTGSSSLGGDWILERSVGNIETNIVFSERVQQSFHGVLETLDWDKVNWTAGATSGTYTINGNTITITLTLRNADGSVASNNPFASGQPAIAKTPTDGGLNQNALQLYVKANGFANTGQYVDVAIIFSQPGGVSDVSFMLSDIDTAVAGGGAGSAGFVDKITVLGTTSDGLVTPTSISKDLRTTEGNQTYTVTNGNVLTGTDPAANTGASAADGNAVVNFGQTGITQINILYQNLNINYQQATGLNDISFTSAQVAPQLDLDSTDTKSSAVEQFSTRAYNNASSGNIAWNGNWVDTETGSSSATAGNVQVTAGTAGTTYGGELSITRDTSSIQRGINLGNFTSDSLATISLNYRTGSLVTLGTDRLAVQVSTDGVNYTTVGTIDVGSNASGSASFDMSNYISATTTIRFKPVTGSFNSGTNDIIYLDNVNVTVTPTAYANAYIENGAPVNISNTNATIFDDGVNMSSLSVAIVNFVAGDMLSWANQTGITTSYNSTTGILTASGTASTATYQSLIRSIQYSSTSDNPTLYGTNTARSIAVSVKDSSANTSNIARSVIAVTGVNDAPTQSGIESTPLTYTENDTATSITGSLSLVDLDNVNLASATVQISGNYVPGQDVLSFITSGNITGSFNATTGILTLSGSDTVANYQAALRSVKYVNTSENPSTASRTVSFTINDGALNSNVATRNISVISVNDAPVQAAIETTPLSFIENGAATTITSLLTISDVDNTTLTSASVQLSSGFQSGADVLSFVNTANITGTFDALTGILTLVGSDTVANYQAALRSVKYVNTSDNPTAATRTVSFTVNDGALNSNIATRNITVTPVNDAPVQASIEGTALSYTENAAPTVITNLLTVSDIDNVNLASATVQIGAGFQSAEDALSFTAIGNITGSYNATTGLLTLSGSDTVANYQAALRSVKYTNSSENPNTATRSVSFTVNDGALNSNIATRNITVISVNDAPVQTAIETSPLNFTENGSAIAVTNLIALSDVDNTTLASASIQISAGFQSGADVLSFVNTSNIIGSYNASTGVLTLTGSDTIANYQAALRSVKYVNTSDNPTAATRTISFTVNDGALNSNVATRNIAVIPVNDAPVQASIETSVLSYTENAAPTSITNLLTLSDIDNVNLASAIVQIGTGFQSAEDALSFTTIGNITGSYNATTGLLTLSGSDTVANYQAALRSVKYVNTSDNPSTATRTVSFTVNDGGLNSNVATRNITVIAVNDAPVTAAIETTPLSYTENAVATAITNLLTLSDIDNTNLVGATVQIATGFQSSEDTLSFTQIGNILGLYNASTGILTFVGSDTVANYQTVLRSVKYVNSSENPSTATRTVSFTVNDGALNSNIATRSINVISVNDAPVTAAIEALPLSFIENGAAMTVTNFLTISDVDNTTMASASIQISAGFQSGADVLSFVNTANITGSYNATTGVLTLTGSDTIANYQAALRSVKYVNTSDDPTTTTRTISFTVNDGAASSNIASRNIGVIAVNDAPVQAAIESSALSYTENAPSTAITNLITLSDIDNINLVGAVIQISSGYQNGEDSLSFTTLGNITGTFNALTGTLTLSGSDTVANYQAALRSVKYTNNSENPNTVNRTVSFVVNDGGLNSNIATRNISVIAVNDAPVTAAIETTPLSFTENGTSIVVTSLLSLSDVDNTTLAGATIQISAGFQANADVLSFVNTVNISGSYNATTGVLTLTGSDTIANYQAALRSIKYVNTSDDPGSATRTVSFTVNDGALNSNVASRNITVIPVNDAPVQAAIESSALSYTENAAATAVTNLLTVSDIDNVNLAGAVVKISAGFQSFEDALSFNAIGNITGSYNATTGILTLSGSDTVANYQAALRSVKYVNSSDNPSTATRTVSFTVNDGALDSNIATRNITVIAVNDAPITAAIETTPLSYIENATATVVTSLLTLSDIDNANLAGAVIQIGSGFQSGEDALLFTAIGNITGSYNTFTGILTLTGNDTVANYQAALRSVKYVNSSDNPSTATRTVNFTVNDGALNSNIASRNITLVAVNDAPVTASIESGALSYTENAAPTAITSLLTLSDIDNVNLAGAVIQISTGLQSAEDALSFTNTGNITGSYNASTGTLTLSGSDTVVNYQAALRSVKYVNSSDNPNIATRTVNFTVSDGALNSNIATRNITVIAVNDAPVAASIETSALPYTENAAPTAITSLLTLSDSDNVNLVGAVIQIGSGFQSAEDVLSFTNIGNIIGSYNASTGTLTLSGSDTVANYQAVLRSVKYVNSSDNPSSATRTVNFTVNDGALNSNIASRNITVIAVNDAPVTAAIETSPLSFTENGSSIVVTNLLTLSDLDNTTLASATVQISAGFQANADVLSFVNTATITGSYNATTGVLTLSGSDTIANYQAALRSIKYVNTSDDPGSATRTVSFTVNDGALNSNVASRNITVIPVNDAPVMASIESSSLSFTENGDAIAITNLITLSDLDNMNLASASVQISAGFQSGADVISFVNTANITGSYNATTGILTLSGSDTVANYQAALRSVKYVNTSDNPSTATRTISFTVNDGALNSNVATRNISVIAVNDAPVTASIETSALSYTENAVPTAVTSLLTLSDIDNVNLAGAIIQIASGFQSGEDALSFTAIGNITGSYNASTGTLTLTGSDTVANYQAALRSVKYVNSSDNPSTATRSVNFTVNDGALNSNIASRNITVMAVNDAPVAAAIESSAVSYTENAAPIVITNLLTLSDIDNVNLAGAIIQIGAGFQSGEDALSFTNTGNISGSYNASTGTLTLSGSDTVANYQAALRSVKYVNSSDNPSIATRTVNFTVNDGALNSNIASRNITVIAVNDAPVTAAIEASSLSFIENGASIAVTNLISLSDLDNTILASASIQISAGFQANADVLSFVNTATITGSYNATTGVLTLSGSDTIANYQAALRSVNYVNTSDNPTTVTRTISFTVNDGALNSNVASRNIGVIAVNDAPVAASIETSALSYTENAAPTVVTSLLTVSDIDNANLAGAVIQIGSGFQSGEDALSFTAIGNITGSYNASTGTLTLTGSDTVANYQAALRSVKFANSSDNPSTAIRSVNFTVNDGALNSNIASRNISVIAVNDAPVTAAIESSALSYTENAPPTSITSLLTLSDIDNANLAGAVIQIGTGFQSHEDALSFTSIGNITGSYNASTGTLTLSGSDTLANYQAALRSVKYVNSSDNPSTATRTVNFTVNDGALNSNIASRNISVIAVNDAPVTAAIETSPLSYTENSAGIAVTNLISLNDLDNTNLAGASIQISAGFQANADVLSFVNTANITGSYNATTGVLTLTGSDTIANYQTALRSIKYVNTSDDPTTATRTVSFTVNDGALNSNVASRNIGVIAVNDAPVQTAIETSPLSFVENGLPMTVTNLIALSDVDNTSLVGARVQISAGFQANADVLSFVDTANITGSFNATTGVLTLSGSDTVANYQAALRSIKYVNTSDDPSAVTRTVSFTVNDGGLNSNVATRNITVSAVNDAPVTAAIETSPLSYTENSTGIALTNLITLSDLDNTTLAGASIQISAGFQANADVLSFINTANITGSFNATTGILTLTGSDTIANYQAALRSIKYVNTSDDPSTATRTVSFAVNDGALNSNVATRNIAVIAVNDAPVTASIEAGALFYTENAAPTVITSLLTVSDVDNTNLAGASVQIGAGFQSLEDALSFTAIGNITGSYNASTGTLTLTGSDTVLNYQAALRSVKYVNSSDNPSTATRTVNFTVNDGLLNSNIAARNISVIAVNDAPVQAAIETSPLSYTENAVPTVITNLLTVSDVDNANLVGATIQIGAGFQSGEDVLSFASLGNIIGSYNATSGTLTLTGNDTVANYQAALRSVKYANSSDNPSIAIRTVNFTVNDGAINSNIAARNISVIAVNDAPVTASIEASPLSFTENGVAIAVTNLLTLSDVDNTNLAGAVIQIGSGFQSAEDALAFTAIGNITGSYNAVNGTLTLSGSDTVAHYQAALRSITYVNNSDNPSTATRTVSFAVNDGALNSNIASRNISVTAVNDAPVQASIETSPLSYTENAAPTVITHLITLSDADNANLAGAVIQIGSGFQSAEDALSFTAIGNISGSYNATNGTLTLSGNDTIANYQAALRSVMYVNSSDNPSTVTRTVSFTVNDGVANSNIASRNISVIAVNDAPVQASIETSSLSYTENAAPTVITNLITLSDADNANLTGAVIQIGSGFQNGEDALSFTALGNITGSYNATTGTLTLTGNDTVAHYQAALRSVTYVNGSDNPSAANRTVSFTVNDGASNSNVASRNITVTPVNDAPVTASIETSPLSFTENGAAIAVTNLVTLSDVDNGTLASASVQIGSGFQMGADILSFANTANITGSYNATTGVLTLTGSDTVANYQTALRSVKYVNTSDDPSTATRTISFSVNDGALNSNIATRNVVVIAVNDAPVQASIETSPLSFTENGAGIALTNLITLSDADNTNLASATVQIGSGFQLGADFLSFVSTASITGNYNATTGVLTLSGSDTVANYQTALRNVKYVNTSNDPSTATRTVSFTVNDGALNSNVATRSITVIAVNDAPVQAAIETIPLSYTENAVPTVITNLLTVSDADNANLAGATIQIGVGFQSAEDILSFTNVGNISGSYNASTGTLTLTGNDTVANYQAALRSVMYVNISDNPSTVTRTVSFTVNDGVVNSNIASRNISVTAVNDAPQQASIETSPLSYTENAAPTVISNLITLSDADNTNLAGAVIQIGAGFQSAEDVLSFTAIGNITGSYNATTGVLTLTGSDTVANYQAALRSATYVNSSDNPSAATSTVSFIVNDGALNSNVASRNISVIPVNDAPVTASIETSPLSFTENGVAIAVTNLITLSDVDNATLVSASVQIGSGFEMGEDVLSFSNSANITGSYNATTGVLTLTGSDTVANYQAALRSVKYVNTSDDPSAATRTVRFTVNDGQSISNVASRNIAVIPVNDAPVEASIEISPLSFTENGAGIALTNLITLSDVDNTTLASASVQIGSGFQLGADFLSFVNTANITGNYNATTGVLTLSGSDTVANYQAALRSVKYVNISDNPSTVTRTVSFTVNDGALNSNVATRNITVIAVNDAPVQAAIETSPLSYTENAVPTVITNLLTVSDADNANLAGAIIQIGVGFQSAEDVLSFTSIGNIIGSYNAFTGTLTLTGNDTVTNYQAALRSVMYVNSSDNPSTSTRTVSFTVNDGVANSNIASRNISVTAVNDAPVEASIETSPLSYTENAAPTVITNLITLSDADNANLAGAVIQIGSGFLSAEDALSFAAIGNITGSYNAATGTLTLTGNDTVANYQAALRSVMYANSSDNPSTATRTVSFSVSDGALNSNIASRNIIVVAVNDAPVQASIETSPLSYTENAAPTVITNLITLSDADNANLAGAVIQIGSGFQSAEDALSFVAIGNITGSYNAATGILTLSGNDTVAHYQAALRSVTYVNGSDNPSSATRTVSFTVNDGILNSNVASRNITVTPINDTPVTASIETSPLIFIEKGAAISLTNLISLSDVDNTNLASAMVQIGSGFQMDADILFFENTANIIGNYNASTGVLTLTGSDSVANYQAALRSVKYINTSDNPTTATRTVSVTVNDGSLNSNVASRNIAVIAVNDAPQSVAIETSPLTYTENAAPIAITNLLTISDADSANLVGAIIQIGAGLQSAEDVLFFTTIGNITGSYNSANGTLTLTGNDTIANYQAALRSVKYVNSSDNPSPATRTVNFTVNDGALNSSIASRNITVVPVNDAPVQASIEAAPLSYTENAAPTIITNLITLSDVDNANLAGAIIQIGTGFHSGEDILSFNAMGNITGNYNAVNGTLTLTGNDTIANYQAALRSVMYVNNSDNPSTQNRSISFTVNDGALTSNLAARTITVIAVNDVPQETAIETAPLSYTENAAPIVITNLLSLSDADTTHLIGATIQIESGLHSGEDILSFTGIGNIIGSYNATTGILTLSGSDTVANYQAALRSVTYANSSDNPSTMTRTISFSVTDGLAYSSAVSRDINVVAVNDVPVAAAIETAPLAYIEGGSATSITQLITLNDADGVTLAGASIQISANYQMNADVLSFVNTPNIVGQFDVATGILTLSGVDSIANYQAALRSILYMNTSDNPSTATRTISFSVNDGSLNSNIANRNIILSAVNQAPVQGAIESSPLSYTENDAATAITNLLTVSDVDSSHLTSAYVQISAGLHSGEDVLSFTSLGNIIGSYNATTGILTLTGNDSIANYQAVLRSVSYANTSDNPSTQTRTISFSVNDGVVSSNVASRDITLSAVNDAPVQGAIETGPLNFVDNVGPIAITSLLTVSDADTLDLTGATVKISSGYLNGEDVLSFVSNGNISGSFDASTGILTLSGIDSVANYQAALRSVKYANNSNAPTAAIRTIDFSVTDSVAISNIASRNIIVQAVTSPNNSVVNVPDAIVADKTSNTLNNGAGSILLSQVAADPLKYQAFYKSSLADLANNGSFGDHLYMATQNATSRSVVVNTLDSVSTLLSKSDHIPSWGWENTPAFVELTPIVEGLANTVDSLLTSQQAPVSELQQLSYHVVNADPALASNSYSASANTYANDHRVVADNSDTKSDYINTHKERVASNQHFKDSIKKLLKDFGLDDEV